MNPHYRQWLEHCQRAREQGWRAMSREQFIDFVMLRILKLAA